MRMIERCLAHTAQNKYADADAGAGAGAGALWFERGVHAG